MPDEPKMLDNEVYVGSKEDILNLLTQQAKESLGILSIPTFLFDSLVETLLIELGTSNQYPKKVCEEILSFPIWHHKTKTTWTIDDDVRIHILERMPNNRKSEIMEKILQVLMDNYYRMNDPKIFNYEDYTILILCLASKLEKHVAEGIDGFRKLFNLAIKNNLIETLRVIDLSLEDVFSECLSNGKLRSTELININFMRGCYAFKTENFDKAFKFLLPVYKSQDKSKKCIKDIARASYLIGEIWTKKLEYMEAENAFKKSIELFSIIDDPFYKTKAYYSYGKLLLIRQGVNYIYLKNNEGKLVAQSVNGMYTSLIPIDLESEEVQREMFDFFLQNAMAEVQTGLTIVEPTGEIRVDIDFFIRMIKSYANVDEQLSLAIADYLVNNNLYDREDKYLVLLEAINESSLNKKNLINKWILFYEYSIDLLDQYSKEIREFLKVLRDKMSKLPKAAEMAKQAARKAKIDYETMIVKEKQSPLTAEEKRKKEKAVVNFIEFGKQYKVLTEKENSLFQSTRNRTEHIEEFINKIDITKAAMEDAKAILELSGSVGLKELMAVVNNLSTVAGKITSGCIMFEEIDHSEITEENILEIAKLLNTEKEIDDLMDIATRDADKLSETRIKLEINKSRKISS